MPTQKAFGIDHNSLYRTRLPNLNVYTTPPIFTQKLFDLAIWQSEWPIAAGPWYECSIPPPTKSPKERRFKAPTFLHLQFYSTPVQRKPLWNLEDD